MSSGGSLGGAAIGTSIGLSPHRLAVPTLAQYTGVSFETQSPAEAT